MSEGAEQAKLGHGRHCDSDLLPCCVRSLVEAHHSGALQRALVAILLLGTTTPIVLFRHSLMNKYLLVIAYVSMPTETQVIGQTEPLPHEACGLASTWRCSYLGQLKKRAWSGRTKDSNTASCLFFTKGCGRVHLEILRATLVWGSTKTCSLAIHFIRLGLQLSHLLRMKWIPATNT